MANWRCSTHLTHEFQPCPQPRCASGQARSHFVAHSSPSSSPLSTFPPPFLLSPFPLHSLPHPIHLPCCPKLCFTTSSTTAPPSTSPISPIPHLHPLTASARPQLPAAAPSSTTPPPPHPHPPSTPLHAPELPAAVPSSTTPPPPHPHPPIHHPLPSAGPGAVVEL